MVNKKFANLPHRRRSLTIRQRRTKSEDAPMRNAGTAALVVVGLVVGSCAAGAAYLPLKPKPAPERVASQQPAPERVASQKRPAPSPQTSEQLFQQFLEWLRRR
jgi:hypothetical protein